MDYKCSNCGAPINKQELFCGQCGQKLDWGGTWSSKPYEEQSLPTPQAQEAKESTQLEISEVNPQGAPRTLETWKTSYGSAAAGIIFQLLLFYVLNRAPSWLLLGGSVSSTYTGNMGEGRVIALISDGQALLTFILFMFLIVCLGLPILYALRSYPSFFSKKSKLRTNAETSFLNCFFGGPIFGPLWNASLTKQKKGSSHIVLTFIYALYAIFTVLLNPWLFTGLIYF